MGICANKEREIERKSEWVFRVNRTEVSVWRGNVFEEEIEAIIAPSDRVLSIEPRYLNDRTLVVVKKCVEYMEKHRELMYGEIADIAVAGKNVVFAVSMAFIDGTFGEPDYARMGFDKALILAAAKGCRKVAVVMDWNYPKQKFVSIVMEIIIKHLEKFSEVRCFVNTDQTVSII
jgi:hypothetical protein